MQLRGKHIQMALLALLIASPVIWAMITPFDYASARAKVLSGHRGIQGRMSKFSHVGVKKEPPAFDVSAPMTDEAPPDILKDEIKEEVRADVKDEIKEAVADLRPEIDRLKEDVASVYEMITAIPGEIQRVEYPGVGDVVDNLVLNYDIENDVAYWGTVALSNDDVYVSVSSNGAAGYLGESGTDGVLRVSGDITYSNGTDFITLSVDTSITNGTYNGQMLWWNQDITNWVVISTAPDTNQVPKWSGSDMVWDTPYKVAVASDSETPDYLGETDSDGVLRSKGIIDYDSDGETVTLYIEQQTYGGQMLWWDQDTTSWVAIATAPIEGDAPVWDGSDMVWSNILDAEVDPVFTSSVAYEITSAMTQNWNTAYGWGNHATNDYAYGVDVLAVSSRVDSIELWPTGNWSEAYAWGDHSTNAYISTDIYVSVSAAAVPGYLGTSKSVGVLRTDGSISYDATGIDYILLGVDSSWSESNILNVVTNAFPDILTNVVSDVCDQNDHPDGDEDGDDGAEHPGDDDPDGYPADDDDDGTDHPSDDDCYSTVPDQI